MAKKQNYSLYQLSLIFLEAIATLENDKKFLEKVSTICNEETTFYFWKKVENNKNYYATIIEQMDWMGAKE